MKSEVTIGLVIFAAGVSKRLGEPKQLLRFQGQTLLRRVTEVGLVSCCRPVIVVLGSYSQAGKLDASAVLDLTVDLDGVPRGDAAMDSRKGIVNLTLGKR